MKAALETLVHLCHGDARPDCPIIDGLAGGSAGKAVLPARAVPRAAH